jgi:hypothetical protein
VAELYQAFKAHKGQLFEVKKHMPNVIKTIVKCYKGFCGIHCQINSYVCAGLTSNHWHKEFIPGNASVEGFTVSIGGYIGYFKSIV